MNTLDSKVVTKKIHVFKAGEQTSAQGVSREFSPEDLQQVVDTYDPGIHEAPLVIGHAGDNDSLPAYGWIRKFERKGKDLYADVEFTDAAKDLVEKGHYRKVSISFYSPESQINPHKGKWSARHLAMLGAAPPAVKGLEAFSFAEEGVFDFVTSLSPETLFDEELGPTMIVEKSPLEMLRDKLQQVRQEVDISLQELKQNESEQTETNVAEEGSDTPPSNSATSAEDANTDNPNQQFSEMKKKMGREGAEKSEVAQQTANLETQAPEETFMEKGGITRKKAKGAHGTEVQVVEEVFEEGTENEGMEPEFDEVSHKISKDGKVSFGTHKIGDDVDDTHRKKTARSEDDSYGDRQKIGKGADEDREGVTKNADQEEDRISADKKSVKNSEMADDRKNAGEDGNAVKAKEDVNGEGRWAGQEDTGKERAMDANQFGSPAVGLDEPNKPGTSDGSDPHGRDGGMTKVATESEESPDNLEMAVDVEDSKGNKKVRVLHQSSSDKRAAVKGGSIDHAEEEEVPAEVTGPDGVTAAKKKLSEEHSEGEKDPMTKTGKGSTYMSKKAELEDDEEEEAEEDFKETEDFCGMDYGMGSMGQAKGMNPGDAMFEELMALKSEHARLKKEYEEQQMAARRDKIARFVENLYSEGKMTDAVMPQSRLQNFCEGLEFGTLEFSEGETPATKLLDLLDRLPNMVHFGEVAGSYQFAEEADLDPHAKALKMVETGEASDYVEAIKKAMYS
jgi:hypothetical protein